MNQNEMKLLQKRICLTISVLRYDLGFHKHKQIDMEFRGSLLWNSLKDEVKRAGTLKKIQKINRDGHLIWWHRL